MRTKLQQMCTRPLVTEPNGKLWCPRCGLVIQDGDDKAEPKSAR